MERARRRRLESRALLVAMVGNAVMAVAGLVAGVASNSGAILLDGLFSLVGFASAWMARRIGPRSDAPPDRDRPFGYAADEAIFATFRALSLLGLVLFAVANAVRNIVAYLLGAPPEPLIFGPMVAYFAGVGAICAGLCLTHALAWHRTGRRSEILKLEATASAFDGLVTLAAGGALWAIHAYGDGWLAPVAPVGDSLVVLFLCTAAVGAYVRAFRGGLAELAGVSAPARHVSAARRALRPALVEAGGRLRDLSVVKLGRTYLVTVYYDPGRPMRAAEVDALNLRMIRDARARLPGADVLLLVTECPRRWPEGVDPYAD